MQEAGTVLIERHISGILLLNRKTTKRSSSGNFVIERSAINTIDPEASSPPFVPEHEEGSGIPGEGFLELEDPPAPSPEVSSLEKEGEGDIAGVEMVFEELPEEKEEIRSRVRSRGLVGSKSPEK
jgi:hypothetical protein